MANQYVIGQTIDKALKSKTASDIFSYDMLGEGSRTETDSIRYFNSYKNAIERIGVTSNQNESVILNDGISVKLSALNSSCKFAYTDQVGVRVTSGSSNSEKLKTILCLF